jgi:catechol 2,3-dioxygenase-like lactoylglutathione lyase family enzyme
MSTQLETSQRANFVAGPARFHLSLNVRDLEKSITFLRALLGCEPAKCRDDYAKFELSDPPLVLSLEPYAASPGGNLNHLGFRVSSSADLVEVQRRLETVGITTLREEGVECCYAKQTKFWVHDPDGNMWEIYTLDEDIEHRGDGHLPIVEHDAGCCAAAGGAASTWNHHLGQKFSKPLPILDSTVDNVSLLGSFNEAREDCQRRIAELFRILKPGGKVQIRNLTAEQDLGDAPINLPGPAAPVNFVPAHEALLGMFKAVGFRSAEITFHGTSCCFQVGDVGLRDTRIEAVK